MSRLQQLVVNRVIESLGGDAETKRPLAELEPAFYAADDYVINHISMLDVEVRRSTRWSLRYGRRRRVRSAAHNERSVLKKLGQGFRHLSEAITLSEDASRDLFVAFGRWLATCDGSEQQSLVDPKSQIGGPALHVLTLLGLHARGCTIASEIELLARKGFVEGAHARARSLYELMVLTGFLVTRNTGNFELTERYHLSAMVEKRKEIPHTGEEDPFAQSSGLEDMIRGRWGSAFFKPYGWAASGIQSPPPTRVTFRDIEEASGLENMRHCYLTMNHAIHAGAMAVTTRFDDRNPFRNATGSQVNCYSTAWVAGAVANFFYFLNRIALEAVSDIVDPEGVFFLASLSRCDAAEKFFSDYAICHEPDVL
ncbi:DUF5677 domain-containing protein [Streptomyces sp. NPDC006662]|uniref:DUF5677 domain-containing protein n=1 Tax=Streptomyces sp. NPDC006662 TaxID=3156902 RepID=UPI0033D7A550